MNRAENERKFRLLYIRTMGVAFALLALLSWGIGDFLIQKSTRKFGDWVALFYIEAFATVALFPFVYRELPALFANPTDLALLFGASVVLIFVAILDLESLRVGKLSVVEPIYAFEVPITAMLAAAVIKEALSGLEAGLITVLIIGIFLVSTRTFRRFRHAHAERGIWYAVFATIGMGMVNFLFGFGARETSPLLVNWFTSAFIFAAALLYLWSKGRAREIVGDLRNNKRLIVSVGFIDNAAWIAYSYSALYIPIAIATSISESYIALAAGLGLVFGRERLQRHQWLGLVLVVVSVVILASITGVR